MILPISDELKVTILKQLQRFRERGYKPPFVAFGDFPFQGETWETEHGEVKFLRDRFVQKDILYVLPREFWKPVKQ